MSLYRALGARANGAVPFKGEAQEVYGRPQGNDIEGKDFPLRRTSIDSVNWLFWLKC